MSNKNKIQKELDQKEFESEIERELRKQELELKHQEKADSDYHPAGLFAIRFFGNLTIGYIIYRIFLWFGGGLIGIISPEISIGILKIFYTLNIGIALIGAITKKSPFDRFLK